MYTRLAHREAAAHTFQITNKIKNKKDAITGYEIAYQLLGPLDETWQQEDFYLAHKIHKYIGNCYFLQDAVKSIAAYQLSLKFARKTHKTDEMLRNKIDIYLGICDTYLHEKKVDRAIVAFRAAINEFSKIKEKLPEEVRLGNIELNPELFWNYYNKIGCGKNYFNSDEYQNLTHYLSSLFQQNEMDQMTDGLENLSVRNKKTEVGIEGELSALFNAMRLNTLQKQTSPGPTFFSKKRKNIENKEPVIAEKSDIQQVFIGYKWPSEPEIKQPEKRFKSSF